MKPEGATGAEQRAFIDKETDSVLTRLAKEDPESKEALASAEGHAIFRYSAGKLPLILTGIGAGSGYGVAVDATDESRTYMKVRKYNWGLGMGVRENSVVFAFSDREVFDKFRSGKWLGGASAEATAKKDETGVGVGGTASVKKGYKVYTLTEAGLSYGVTYETLRYSPVGKLND